MSDILVSELLVLALLILPLIRPFSKGLNQAAAIPIFPLFAGVITVFIILGQGLYFSLVPVILIVVICIITEFARFVMMVRQVPNHFYSIPAIILRIFLIFLLAGCVFIIFSFSGEREVECNFAGATIEEIKFKNEIAGMQFFKPQKENRNLHILVLDAFNSIPENQNTITRYLINEGYSVSQVNILQATKPDSKLNLKRLPEFSVTLKKVLTRFGFKIAVPDLKLQDEEFNLLIDESIKKIKRTGSLIFVFCEGQYNQALYNYAEKNPNAFAGIFFADSGSLKNFTGGNNHKFFILGKKDNLKFSKEIAQFPYCLFIQNKTEISEFGELGSNDVLAAKLLGGSRDIGREERIFLAQSFGKWMNLK